jgi:hypothetical protein
MIRNSPSLIPTLTPPTSTHWPLINQQPGCRRSPLASVHQYLTALCPQICHCGVDGECPQRQRAVG